MHVIYCIPGFGVDEKIYTNLKVDNAELRVINWLDPEKGESFRHYAERMAAFIEDESPVTIFGISFGGMVAQEIAKFRKVKQIILISSVKSRAEMPMHLKFAGALRLNRLFPVKKIQQNEKFYKIANKRLGAVTEEEQKFANMYRKSANLNYVNWSFNIILNWQNQNSLKNIVHIHGEKDQIFPIKNIRPDFIIKGGTHMMVWNRAAEVSAIINSHLLR